jgi:anaerobic magnesium-protoporphyrin IX monomethyl ester cyclase
MTVQGNFIFGDPVETLETAEETFRFLRKYKNINISYGFILPFPGTVLYYNLKTKGAFKGLMDFYENSGSEDNLKNMTKLSKIDFRYLCRRVHQEQNINFASSHVIRSRHISKNLFDLVVECRNCKETVQFQLDIEKKRRMVCKYCYQRINVLKIDVKFSLSEFLNRIYRNYIAGIVISNPIVHKAFSYWILEGYRKMKRLRALD